MGLYDSQQFHSDPENMNSQISEHHYRLNELENPHNPIIASTIEVTDGRLKIDEQGLSMNGSQILYDGKVISDVINDRLNTATSQILGNFTFGTSGAFSVQIDQNNGLWFSGNGLLAKHQGQTSLTIPINGSPTFRGTIAAGSVIAATMSADLINTGTLNGSVVNVANINADNIVTGTLVGRTVKASGGVQDVWLLNSGAITWQYGGAEKGYIYANNQGQFMTLAESDYYIQAYSIYTHTNGNTIFTADDIILSYDDDNTGNDLYFMSKSNSIITGKLTTTGRLDIRGTLTQNAYDFAEYFENHKKKIIPKGTSVVIEDGKVREAKKGEIPFGVVSSTPAVVGNSGAEDAGTSWHGKYLRDEDMQYVMEKVKFTTYWIKPDNYAKSASKRMHIWGDEKPPKEAKKIKTRIVERPKINPDYDETRKFIPREDRPKEWTLVGLMGQVLVRKGQQINPQWVKVKEFNQKHDLYVIR
jgi:hypothetical protein